MRTKTLSQEKTKTMSNGYSDISATNIAYAMLYHGIGTNPRTTKPNQNTIYNSTLTLANEVEPLRRTGIYTTELDIITVRRSKEKERKEKVTFLHNITYL